MFKEQINLKSPKGGVRGGSPRGKFVFKGFFSSVKSIIMVAEKDRVVGLEPVTEFLPAARPKSGINLVLDTEYLQG